jgi:hypothetical protein
MASSPEGGRSRGHSTSPAIDRRQAGLDDPALNASAAGTPGTRTLNPRIKGLTLGRGYPSRPARDWLLVVPTGLFWHPVGVTQGSRFVSSCLSAVGRVASRRAVWLGAGKVAEGRPILKTCRVLVPLHDTGDHEAAVASQERCKWRRGAAPWWSMLGRGGRGLVDVLGVSTQRFGRVDELAAEIL